MIYKMNENTVIEVETPFGKTEKTTVGEIVKQGTFLGPTLCCVSTDQVNNIGESQERSLGKEYIAILIFVDDVMSAGGPEDARKAIRNFKEMEDLKKYTYGPKKTKYMVLNTGKEKEEAIEEDVSLGRITKTNEYKYVGFHLNESGNCLHHIEQKTSKIPGQINAIKSIANFNTVGERFLAVRLQLYESCVLPSMLYGLETWHQHMKSEIRNLEKMQAKALHLLLGMPHSTPYVGLLSELGIWRMEEMLDYRRIMLLQNLLQSDDRRLCKRVIINQREDEEEGTFYQTTKEKMDIYKIEATQIENMSKNQLKKIIKTEINKKMAGVVNEASKRMKKMRFTKPETEFKRKDYLLKMSGSEALHTLKTRLNMLPVHCNFRGDTSLETKCWHCKMEDDSTEHLIECEALGPTFLKKEYLVNSSNVELWKLINERTKFNLDNRKKSEVRNEDVQEVDNINNSVHQSQPRGRKRKAEEKTMNYNDSARYQKSIKT